MPPSARPAGEYAWAVWGLLLVIAATALLRVHLIHTPLERDEGEYAYAGQLMLQGIPPYQLAANMKLPGTYAAYAAVMAVFGQSIEAVHAGLLLANAGAIVLIFLLGRRWFSAAAGLAAAAAYAVVSLCGGVLGTQAHATHFVVLFALAGLLLLPRWAWWSGVLFGIAVLMKQHGVFFGFFGAAWILAMPAPWTARLRKVAIFAAGAVTPFALMCLWLWRVGVFDRFWFWTVTYVRHYGSENSLKDGAAALVETFGPILRQTGALWLLAAAGLVWLARDRAKSRWFAAGLLGFSFLAVCPGLYFRGHYIVLMLPAVALLAGSMVRGRRSAAVFVAAVAVSIVAQREFLFRMSPTEISRELYGLDPFPEAVRMGDYIREHAARDAKIAMIGSEPEIYFYAQRHSATPYLYIEPMVEPQPFAFQMQGEMVGDLERAQPEYVVRFPIEETLALGGGVPTRLFDWWKEYGPRHYRLVAIADVLPDGSTEYRWGEAAETYQARSLYYLAVYRKL